VHLASPKMLPSVREAIEAKIIAGESVTAHDIRRAPRGGAEAAPTQPTCLSAGAAYCSVIDVLPQCELVQRNPGNAHDCGHNNFQLPFLCQLSKSSVRGGRDAFRYASFDSWPSVGVSFVQVPMLWAGSPLSRDDFTIPFVVKSARVRLAIRLHVTGILGGSTACAYEPVILRRTIFWSEAPLTPIGWAPTGTAPWLNKEFQWLIFPASSST
jgi:hypothetical protein